MASEKRTILRTVRVNPTLDKWIKEIADNENRTVSNTIYNLLCQAVNPYIIDKTKREKRKMDYIYESAALEQWYKENEDIHEQDNED